jgi:hypothetical protein
MFDVTKKYLQTTAVVTKKFKVLLHVALNSLYN